jgi:hypothetical protein
MSNLGQSNLNEKRDIEKEKEMPNVEESSDIRGGSDIINKGIGLGEKMGMEKDIGKMGRPLENLENLERKKEKDRKSVV